MIRIAAFATAFSLAFVAAAHADVSREWREYAAAVKADCAAFRATLADPLANAPILKDWNRVSWPYAPARPHICIFLRFDLDADGAPLNAEAAHIAPDNIAYRFKREAMLTLKDMSFELSEATPDGFQGMWIEVKYDACGPRLKHRCIGISAPRRPE
jgi:hypothetical protein